MKFYNKKEMQRHHVSRPHPVILRGFGQLLDQLDEAIYTAENLLGYGDDILQCYQKRRLESAIIHLKAIQEWGYMEVRRDEE